jgi:hypothetical protein
MSNHKKISVLIVLALVLLPLLTLSGKASTSAVELMKSADPSGPEQHPKITQLQKEIAAAENVDQARQMALVSTDGALDAIQNVRRLMPLSDDLRNAEIRLSDARSRMLAASSQEQVADEFSGMMIAGLDDDRAANVSVGKVGCGYSTGEIIAIVIGLILGIIPGLILLVVLC